MEAAELLKQGMNQSEVARRRGVHRQSVIRWVRQLAHSFQYRMASSSRSSARPLGRWQLQPSWRRMRQT